MTNRLFIYFLRILRKVTDGDEKFSECQEKIPFARFISLFRRNTRLRSIETGSDILNDELFRGDQWAPLVSGNLRWWWWSSQSADRTYRRFASHGQSLRFRSVFDFSVDFECGLFWEEEEAEKQSVSNSLRFPYSTVSNCIDPISSCPVLICLSRGRDRLYHPPVQSIGQISIPMRSIADHLWGMQQNKRQRMSSLIKFTFSSKEIKQADSSIEGRGLFDWRTTHRQERAFVTEQLSYFPSCKFFLPMKCRKRDNTGAALMSTRHRWLKDE